MHGGVSDGIKSGGVVVGGGMGGGLYLDTKDDWRATLIQGFYLPCRT